MSWINEFQQLLVMDDLSPREFQKLLAFGQHFFGLSDAQCGHIFYVSVPSVSRWRRGVTMPRPVLRSYIQKVYKEMLLEREFYARVWELLG